MQDGKDLCFPPFRLDLLKEKLWRESQEIILRPKTFAILRYLAAHPERLVTKAELLRAVWGDTRVSEEGLRDYVREIRQALNDDAAAPQFVETVRGRGYHFLPAVTAQPVPSSRFQVPSVQAKETSPRLGTLNLERGTSLVGREPDLTHLHHWLEKALNGERQLVFVTGEPGIGKTALLQSLASRVQSLESENPNPAFSTVQMLDAKRQTLDVSVWLGWGQCIEHYGQGEAYLPILDALGRLCRRPEGGHLIDILRKHAPMWLAQLPAFIESEELEALQRKIQGASRERMLRELAEALEMFTAEQPLVLVLEDLHWSDVSTLDVLAFLARRKEPARLMVIGTYRPAEMLSDGHPLKNHVHELAAHQLCVELALGPLSEAAVGDYLATRLGRKPSRDREGAEGQPLADARGSDSYRALTHTLYHRTDGNPLFLVSLVDDLVARHVLVKTDGEWRLQENTDAVFANVPESIRQLVTRQRERLQPEEQRILEAASVAGMEFSAAAVAAALATDTATVERHCDRLAERQQFLRHAGIVEWPDGTVAARYSFLHALYQQFWHERVSVTHLQHLHLQIGQRKEQAYGDRAREIAAELAMHFEQGRNYRRAVQYLQYAGENATRRSAHQEAIGLLTKGLRLLKMLSDTPDRARQEITLQLALGPPLSATKGAAAPELEKVLARLRELSQQVEATPQLFSILHGAVLFYVGRAVLHTARELAEQLFALAQNTHDPLALLASRWDMAATLLLRGEFVKAREHAEQGLVLYDRYRNQPSPWQSHRGGVGCLNCIALVLWALGYPDEALRKSQEAIIIAQETALPLTLAEALDYAVWLHQTRREWQAAEERAAALVTLCTEQGFPLFQAEGTIVRGWALAEQGREEEGVAQIRQGLVDYQATGAEVTLPGSLALLAAVYQKRGQAEEGLEIVAEALRRVDKTGGHTWEAELYRLKGELLLARESQKSKVESPQFPTPNA